MWLLLSGLFLRVFGAELYMFRARMVGLLAGDVADI